MASSTAGERYRPGVARKRQILKFSGVPTWDGGALRESLERAARAHVTAGGFLVYPVDPSEDVLDNETLKFVSVVGTEVLATTSGSGDLEELVSALASHEVTDMMCMCTGDLAIEFFAANGDLVDVVRVDLPTRIEWPRWPGKASLVDPERLQGWLARHEVTGS